MVGENLLVSAANPSSRNDAVNHEIPSPVHENEPKTPVLIGTEQSSSRRPSGNEKLWDGIGSDGCRHVRWKGSDA